MAIHSNVSVAIISGVNLDVPRAYAITFKGTAKALSELGYETTLISPDKQDFLSTSKLLILKLIAFIMHSSLPFSKFAFFIHQYIFSYFVARWISNTGFDIVWTRNYALLYHLRKNKIKKVLEIHQNVSRVNHFLLRRSQTEISKIAIGVVSEQLFNDPRLESLRSRIVHLPVGVSDCFFEEINREQTEQIKYTFGYFGSFNAMGEDQGILNMLKQISECSSMLSNIRTLIVGVGLKGKEKIEAFVAQQQIKGMDLLIISYLPNCDLPLLMRQCEFLISPNPESAMNSSRFSNKIMEYASTGRRILATNTIGHRNAMRELSVDYYETSNLKAFYEILTQEEVGRSRELSTKNIQISRLYSFKSRVLRIMPLI